MEHTNIREDIDRLMYVLNAATSEKEVVNKQKNSTTVYLAITLMCCLISYMISCRGSILSIIATILAGIGLVILFWLYRRYDQEIDRFIEIYHSPKDTTIELIRTEGIHNMLRKSRIYLSAYCAIRMLNAVSFIIMSISLCYVLSRILK